jgi:hypothetical protein
MILGNFFGKFGVTASGSAEKRTGGGRAVQFFNLSKVLMVSAQRDSSVNRRFCALHRASGGGQFACQTEN